MNCQIVLVPEVNDGLELERTLEDLSTLYPSIKSVAVVPVGTTKYREGLYKVKTYDRKRSEELLNLIGKEQGRFINILGTRFVFASDEFYAMTNRPLPSYEAYEGFPQIENGVGLMKSFEYEIDRELDNIKGKIQLNKKISIGYRYVSRRIYEQIKDKIMNKFNCLDLKVVPIENDFFGTSITVSGLVTGGDIIKQIKNSNNIDGIIIPRSMLRKDSNVF